MTRPGGLRVETQEAALRVDGRKSWPAALDESWESSSSGSSSSIVPTMSRERAMSDPVSPTFYQGAMGNSDDFRRPGRCMSWPMVRSTGRSNSLAEDILVAPFHDKAVAFVRTDAGERGPTISPWSFLLWVVFGASGWWSTNAISSQLPFLTEVLPEKNRLGNKLSAMVQFGNLFLAAYMLSRRWFYMDPVAVICAMMTLGVAALGGCALFWDCVMPGESLPLLALTVIAGGVGCTSGVTYWTFLLLYPPRCTIAASVGMSLGGVVANVLAALQFCGTPPHGRTESSPRFGPSAFFAAAAALQMLAMACFLSVRDQGRPQRTGGGTSNGQVKEPLLEPGKGVLLGHIAQKYGIEPQEDLHQGVQSFFCLLNFSIRGVTYLMPTLMPYVAAAYPTQKMQLLFWMLLGQQLGETTGRALSPSPGVAAVVGGFAVLVFAAFVAAALWPLVLSTWLPQAFAQMLIPAACTFFFLSYGMIETAIFKWIRGVSTRSRVVEDLSAMTGSCGQMGSLSSTFVVFLCFELRSGRRQR